MSANVRRFPAGDGEMELTTEVVSHNDNNTTTVAFTLRVTKPITIAIFPLHCTGECEE